MTADKMRGNFGVGGSGAGSDQPLLWGMLGQGGRHRKCGTGGRVIQLVSSNPA